MFRMNEQWIADQALFLSNLTRRERARLFFCSFFCSYLSFVSWSGVRENGMLELGSWVLISNGCMEAAFVVRLFALFVLDQWSGDLLPLAFLLCCW